MVRQIAFRKSNRGTADFFRDFRTKLDIPELAVRIMNIGDLLPRKGVSWFAARILPLFYFNKKG